MSENVLVLNGEGQVDVQVGGPGNNWDYLSACATLSGPSVPEGGIEIRWCQDPQKAGKFKVSSQFQTAPDQATGEITTKLGKIDFLTGLRCMFGLRARYAKCGERENPSNYDPLMLNFCTARVSEHSYSDLVVADPGAMDEIIVTSPWSALSEYRIRKVFPARLGSATTLGDQQINDLAICDEANCGGYCGDATDGCAKVWAVTNADVAPYAAPNLIKGVKAKDAWTLTNYPILGLNGNVSGIECAGTRLVVSSNTDSAIAYNDSPPNQNEWVVVPLGNAPAATPNALFMRTAREGYVGCANGYVYKTVDGGLTWTAVLAGTWTTQTINAVWAYDKDLVYAVGNLGNILRSDNGGATWTDWTDVAQYGNANLLVVIVPAERPKEVLIGTNNGKLWRSKNQGADWTQIRFPDDGVGTVDDLAFCGPCGGDVLYILHNDAGPRARILRDLSGGAGGADVEIVMEQTQVIPVGVQLKALDCCDVNYAFAGGAVYGGFPALIQVS
jgi:photosystem II stability/assembly factor-like uncharacterized protein